MMKKDYVINVYNEEGEVVIQATAQHIKLTFGTVRDLFKLLKIENATDTAELFGVIYELWDEVLRILSQIFPDITDEEWSYITLDELIPVVLDVVKDSISTMGKSISGDEKN